MPRPFGRVSSAGVDFGKTLDFARTRGGRALREREGVWTLKFDYNRPKLTTVTIREFNRNA